MNLLKPVLNLLLPFILITLPLPVCALTSDDQQPLHITSNGANLDYKAGVLTYTGNVIAIQGTQQLNGDKLVIQRNSNGQIDNITIYGSPARYRGLPDVNQPVVHAEALMMTYQPGLHLFTLRDQAKIEQNGNVSQAPLITYNTLTQIVDSPQNSQGRTTMIIQPYSKQQKQ